MTQFESYEEQLFNDGIIIKEHSLPNDIEGMCFKYENDLNLKDLIIYDRSKLTDSQSICGVLMHEEMHLTHSETMYSLDEPTERIKSKERKANRLIARKYIPQQMLYDLLYKKKLQLFEISEELCIPERIVKDAYEYYSSLESWMKKKLEEDFQNAYL